MTEIGVAKVIEGEYSYGSKSFKFKVTIKGDVLGVVERISSDIYSYMRGLREYNNIKVNRHEVLFEHDVAIHGDDIKIDGKKVTSMTPIGYGSQYTVLLARTDDGHYIIEVGISGRGQYVEVLSKLDELDEAIDSLNNSRKL